MLLPEPVGPTSATEVPALHREREVGDGRPPGIVGMRDAVEFDVAFHPAEHDGAGFVAHAGLGIEDLEKVGHTRQPEELTGDEAGRLLEPDNQQCGEAHEADDLADRNLAPEVKVAAEEEDSDHGDRRGHPAQHRDQRPQIEHRELSGEQALHHRAYLLRLKREAHEALHQRHVAERVPGPRGEL